MGPASWVGSNADGIGPGKAAPRHRSHPCAAGALHTDGGTLMHSSGLQVVRDGVEMG